MQLASWIGVIRDVNLKKIQLEATSPFSVLLVGDQSHTQSIADVLGRTATSPVCHPWVTQHPLPLPDGFEMILPAVAIVASGTPDLDIERRETLRRLRAAGVHTITLLVGDRALWPEPAWQLRVHEDARVAVRPHPDALAIQEGLAPTFLAFDKEGKLSMLAMARQLPVLRAPYASALAEDVARTNGGFALSTGLFTLVPGFNLPLTATDMIVLTKNQILMAYRIALAAGKTGEAREVLGEVVGVLGAGLLFRQIARELVGLVPGVGLVPKVAVAYAGTHVVAKVATAWALEGRTVEVGELRMMYDASLARGKALAGDLYARSTRRTSERESGRLLQGSPSQGRMPRRLASRLRVPRRDRNTGTPDDAFVTPPTGVRDSEAYSNDQD